MDEEARQLIKELVEWLYNNGYVTNNNIDAVVNFTEKGSQFMSDTFGTHWDYTCWSNFSDSTSIWLPYPGFEQWDYAWTEDWKLHKEEYDNRLDIFIKAIGADVGETDYIELDDIVL